MRHVRRWCPIPLTRRLVLAAMCALVTVVGSCAVTISSNFWLNSFPNASSSGQFAVALFAAVSYFIFFSLLLVPLGYQHGWHVVKCAFLGQRFRWRPFLGRLALLFCVGLNDIGTSLLSFFAIPHTSETVQALLQTTIPFFALGLSCVLVRGEWGRTRVTRNLVLSFAFMMAGLVVASWRDIFGSASASSSPAHADAAAWAAIYVLSCAVYAGWCVAQRLYLDGCIAFHAACGAASSSGGGTLLEPSADAATSSSSSQSVHSPLVAGPVAIPDAVQKLTMLVGDAFFTMLLAVALLPIDALPWFGTSPDVGTSWQRFTSGLRFIFDNTHHNAWLGVGYVASEVSTYVSCAYLNAYSPTLSSFVVQLAGPVTALLVVGFPALQPASSGASGSGSGSGSAGGGDGQDRSALQVLEQVGGTLLVAAACLLYYRWEVETTGAHKSITAMAVAPEATAKGSDDGDPVSLPRVAVIQ